MEVGIVSSLQKATDLNKKNKNQQQQKKNPTKKKAQKNPQTQNHITLFLKKKARQKDPPN